MIPELRKPLAVCSLTNERFDELLVETINEVLMFVFGDKSAQNIYNYLQRKSCAKKEIPRKLEVFSTELRNVLNDNRPIGFSNRITRPDKAVTVERTIARILCRKLGTRFLEETGPLNLSSFILELRSLYVIDDVEWLKK